MQFYETETRIAPPPGFRGAEGVVSVRLLPHQLPPALSGARRDGVRYEAKFHSYACGRWSGLYRTFQSHAFRFSCRGDSESRLAIPDGILELPDRIVVFECKLRHCSISFFQLTRLYKPLLEAYKQKPVTCIEVCKHYDPQTSYPPHAIVKPSDLDSWDGPEKVGVCLWKP